MTHPLLDKSEGHGGTTNAPHFLFTLRELKEHMDKILTKHFKRMEIERSKFKHK